MTRIGGFVTAVALLFPAGAVAQDGAELYELGCASCHGVDGSGAESEAFAFDDPLPDFRDCSFASREPDADWIIVAKAGGPVRGFSESMPAYGEAFDDDRLQAILDHIRSFCTDRSWPRGELNLPRPLVTEKAYPEDEAVWTTAVHTEGLGSVINEIVYEKRFGARSQIEVKVPFGFAETEILQGGMTVGSGDWDAGLGNLALGFKHAALHDDRTILSLAGEVKIPTSPDDSPLGSDHWVIEPFVAFGRLLPADAFVHAQAGLEIPAWAEVAGLPSELFWRGVIGKTFTSGEFGRAWSPMVEILGSREVFGSEAVVGDSRETSWDLVPQMQVTLNTRQHVMLNLGVRLPLTDAGERPTQLIVYVLWDWFDGGLFDGW